MRPESAPLFDATLDSGDLALLQQGYRNNWQQYLSSLEGSEARIPHWDICVLTASNAHQAEAYEAQLQARREAGLLPVATRFVVVADPAGLRIGSGGATLHVLAELSRQASASQGNPWPPFASQRILIIHSGGDSRRLPHCSATGKLFARIPHELPDGRPSSLFDEFLVSLSGLPAQIPAGALIASGDVLLLYDHLQLTFSRPGITGVAAVAPVETGTHHGVYVTAGSTHQVRTFLHKPSLERLVSQGALQTDGRVSIDTGLVWVEREALNKLLALAERLSGEIARGVTINLYGDLLAPLAQTTAYEAFLADASDGPATPALQEARRLVWECLRGVSFTVERLDPAVFVHFGSTREYLQVLQEGVRALKACGWRSRTASWVAPTISAEGDHDLVAVNAYVREGALLSGCLLDAHLETRLETAEGCLLANVSTERSSLALGASLVLDQLPLRAQSGYVTRLFGVMDDPKRSLAEGGTFLNLPWADWLAAGHLTREDLWPQAEGLSPCTLWDAKLYPVCAAREESLDLVLWMQSPKMATTEMVSRWRTAPRLSLGESFLQADVQRLVREHAEVEDLVRARRYYAGLERERPARELVPLLGASQDVPRRARLVADWLESSLDPWLPLRGYRALAVATHESRWEDRAFSALARLVRAHTPSAPRARWSDVEWQQSVTVSAAARIDFGGGWTDTPPYSLERGGTVLNAAIMLQGELPIQVEARVLSEPALVLECHDIEATIRPRFASELLNYANPADPFALHKAALVFQGIIPADIAPETELADILRPPSHGLYLATTTSIPRGSGLGTSSILAGVILACLARLTGQPMEQGQLFDQVLCLEQMITTGGGWQDQVGGLVGGIKFITTPPGLPQVVRIEPAPLIPALRRAFDERLLLVYTGQSRLAKGLLRAMVRRFMARDPEMVAMLGDIAQLAQAMYRALRAEDLDTFGELIAQHWEINKRMDPGCTNPFIDDLMALCRPYTVGAKLAGAGGGGFALAIAKDEEAGRALQCTLQERYPQSQVRLWSCCIAENGIRQSR